MSNESVVVEGVDTAQLKELLQSAGYRTTESEQNGVVQLLSASQGIGFALRPGNLAQESGKALDFTLSCALRVQGELPVTLVGEWNRNKRFSRLAEHGDFLVLEMDVVVAGGVSDRYLRANIELWDRLLQEFLLFLRNFARDNVEESALAESNSGEQEASAELSSTEV